MTDLSRRKLLTAGAWAVPVVAVTVATPLVAASTVPGFELSVPETARVGVVSETVVTISATLLPLAAETVRLRYTQTSGLAVSYSGYYFGAWLYFATSRTEIEFRNTAGVGSASTFSLSFNGPSTWNVELITPDGTLERTLEIVA